MNLLNIHVVSHPASWVCHSAPTKQYGCKYREDIFEEKPTLCELCEHIHIGSKWYQLGIMLKLDSKKLNDIQKLPEDSTHKTSKMF